MKKYLLLVTILFALTGCGGPVETSQLETPAKVSAAVLDDRLLEFSESSGVVYVKFQARDAGTVNLTKKGVLDDSRSVIRALYTNDKFKPVKVTTEAVFSVKSETGQIRDAVVARQVFDRTDPVAWENIHTLENFERLLSISEFFVK